MLCWDTLPQDGDLGLQEAYLGVVPWSEELDEQAENSLEGICHHGSLTPQWPQEMARSGDKKGRVDILTPL